MDDLVLLFPEFHAGTNPPGSESTSLGPSIIDDFWTVRDPLLFAVG